MKNKISKSSISKNKVSKNYANLDYGQTHYRRAGEGRPLVMLHASPMSSELMVPMISELLDVAEVFAPDTPGYGNSDALPAKFLNANDDLSPYVKWLHDFLEVVGLDKVGLYGTATGAQIAIEFARAYPEKLEYLVLDNAAHFTDDERQKIMNEYFPDILPKQDGSHLKEVWDMAAGVFQWFPWYAQDEEHRISNNEPAVDAVHATALAYLAAGRDYAQAYRRAFMNEDASRVLDVQIPVRVIRWQGSVLKKYVDRYDDFNWPSNVEMVHCDSDSASRLNAIKQTVKEFG